MKYLVILLSSLSCYSQSMTMNDLPFIDQQINSQITPSYLSLTNNLGNNGGSPSGTLTFTLDSSVYQTSTNSINVDIATVPGIDNAVSISVPTILFTITGTGNWGSTISAISISPSWNNSPASPNNTTFNVVQQGVGNVGYTTDGSGNGFFQIECSQNTPGQSAAIFFIAALGVANPQTFTITITR